jgi:hypothetical protein
MKITRDELLRYAAHGVRDRLHQMQKELNELARLFPDIVCHQDGTVPSVLPIELKPTAKPNGPLPAQAKHAPAKRRKYASAARGYWAKMTPAERSKEVARRRAVTLANKKRA